MKAIALSFIVACFAMNALAQENPSPPQARTLDIVEVISQTTDEGSCGLVPMRLVYRDSHGTVQTLDYTIVGSGCSNG